MPFNLNNDLVIIRVQKKSKRTTLDLLRPAQINCKVFVCFLSFFEKGTVLFFVDQNAFFTIIVLIVHFQYFAAYIYPLNKLGKMY